LNKGAGSPLQGLFKLRIGVRKKPAQDLAGRRIDAGDSLLSSFMVNGVHKA
jgi:hypothetical protein